MFQIMSEASLLFLGFSRHSANMLKQMSYEKWICLVLAALLGLRLIILFVAPWGLHGDEAQYWAWSQDLDFGYFSKPPMIAWVIASTTGVFGHAEWAVRLAAPFLHCLTAVMIFLTGRKILSAQIGFWAALTYILMPAVWLSSYIISTDAVLLLFWSIGLHAWASLREKPSWGLAIQLGLALGFGLLSKYAMAFFIPPLIFAALFDPASRKALLGPKGVVVTALAIACLIPNLMWNAAHDFATIAHTAENANLQKDLFHPLELLRFWVDQFGVLGPLIFPILGLAILAMFRKRLASPALWLALFSLTPFLVISLEAFLSRANANWAVTSYGAGVILVALWSSQTKTRLKWLKIGLGFQTIITVSIAVIFLNTSLVDQLKLDNSVKRLRAWPETAVQIEALVKDGDYDSVATDNRLVFYGLNHYGIGATPLQMWRLNNTPKHHADLTRPLEDGAGSVLLISQHKNFEAYFREDFETLSPLTPIEIALGPRKVRTLYLYEATTYSRTQGEDRN